MHVLAGGMAVERGQRLSARGVPELRGDSAVLVSYDVLVVTAG